METELLDNGHVGDLAGPYAIDACSAEEARSVAGHASGCPACAAEIARLRQAAGWIGASAARAPAPGLRSRVLAAALAARPADHTGPRDAAELGRLTELYRTRVAELDRLVSELSPAHWQLPSAPHGSLRELMVHLHANDGLVATAAGLDPSPVDARSPADVRLSWRRQAGALVEVVGRRGSRLRERQVPLAGRRAIRRPLREALIQRGFETWTHAEDVRRVLDLPPRRPGGQQIADIVGFALPLLPAALAAAGRAHPGRAVRLALTGEGGGIHLVGLSPAAPTGGAVVAEISLPAERFCRLLAGRLTGPAAHAEIGGDPAVAADFLAVAATMGCD
ncbi:hypothetical protein [Actinoplanes sp. NPDC049599]|uniref:hypothetical protein n=1 Tax=Actinoplanes sp. NPDC049599 TaxID=3363903 RepID=UPI0037915342